VILPPAALLPSTTAPAPPPVAATAPRSIAFLGAPASSLLAANFILSLPNVRAPTPTPAEAAATAAARDFASKCVFTPTTAEARDAATSAAAAATAAASGAGGGKGGSKGGKGGGKKRKGKGAGAGGGPAALKALKDNVCLAIVVSGSKLAEGLGAPTVLPEPVGGPGPGPEAEAAAEAAAAAAVAATKGSGKKGKKGKNGGGGGAVATAPGTTSAASAGSADSAASAESVPMLSEWHLTVTPSQGTSGRQVSFSVLGHGPDDDRTVDLLRQGLAGAEASSGNHNGQKGGKGGKKGGKNGSSSGGGRGSSNKNTDGAAAAVAGGQQASSSSSLWTVRCAAADCAVVLSLLELRVPGLAFFVYAHPGHFDVAAARAANGTALSGAALTAPGSSAAVWGKLQASLRARCHHPLKGGGHLSLKGCDLALLRGGAAAGAAASTGDGKRNGDDGDDEGKPGTLSPFHAASSNSGGSEGDASTAQRGSGAASLRPLTTRLSVFFGRTPPPISAAEATNATGDALPTPPPPAGEEAAPGGAVKAAAAAEVSPPQPPGHSNDFSNDNRNSSKAQSEDGLARARSAMTAWTLKGAADNAVAALATGGVLKVMEGWCS